MSRFKQNKYILLILPLVLLLTILAANEEWSIAGGTSYTLKNTASVTGFTDGSGTDHSVDISAEAVVIVTVTSAQEELCFIPPVLTAEAGTNQSITCGAVVILGGSPTAIGGTPPYTYEWSCDQPICNITNTTDANPTVNPDFRETIYTVVITDGNSCVANDSVLVTVEDAPQAVVTASPTVACVNQPVDFDGFDSAGVPPLVYNWDFGDGTMLPAGPASYTHTYTREGIFNASLTVIDNNGTGCMDSAFIDIYVTGAADLPTGLIYFTFLQDPIPADGTSTALATSNVIYGCDGITPIVGRKITVMTDRGTILNGQLIDEDPAPGIQISTNISGQISFTLQSDNIGGTATVMARSVEGNAEGASQIEFQGSTSLPIVIGAYPSGDTSGPVSVIYARFNKDMDGASVCALGNYSVLDETTGPVACNCYYDEANRMAVFTPQVALDMDHVFRVTISGDVFDSYLINTLDGNYNGFAEGSPVDDFTWRFGNTIDKTPPVISCVGHAPDPVSPDGDQIDDTVNIDAFIMDNAGVQGWGVMIQDEFGNVIRTIMKPGAVSGIDSIEWDGKDEDGLVVDNGSYSYILMVTDMDWNVTFNYSCLDPINVISALDPAYFRGKSGSVVGP
ncbi:MAG: PKD domain-containing protein [Deltaproteobacteria bacterium]|nr:MAG: PKD domain-containing protein [Deltaproteobacteria bacterium]